ncbi:hypothetical protein CPB85DRAFT_1433652 [Mucidula mucida]|nr:hypothetical protein CPB85DRAFT_1433652 [Mucidula mucida]
MLNKDTRSLLSASTRSTSTWKSRSTAKAMHPSSSSQDKSSTDEFGSKLSHWPTTSSNSKSSKSLYPLDPVSREHPIRLPIPSQLKSTHSMINSLQRQNRRSSLPAAPPSRKVDLDRFSLQKRHSSLRSNKPRRRSTSAVPYSSSVRMVDGDIIQDDSSLPLSPHEQRSSTTYLNNDQPTNNSVPPLPALPPPVISADRHSTDTPALISHPYPLAKRNKAIEGLPSGSYGALNQSPSAGLPMTPSSATSSPFPHPQTPIPAFPGIKKPRKSSLKARRSPPLGPSPLRIMTLPEGSITDLASLNFMASSPQLYNGRSPSQRNSYSHIGLGFPSNDSRRSSVATKSDDDKRSSTSSRRLTRLNDDGTNVLLGIIRELVEESSQWDADLYMDSNFRHLLENANTTRNLDGSLADSLHDADITSPMQVEEGLFELDAVRSQFMDSDDQA